MIEMIYILIVRNLVFIIIRRRAIYLDIDVLRTEFFEKFTVNPGTISVRKSCRMYIAGLMCRVNETCKVSTKTFSNSRAKFWPKDKFHNVEAYTK